MRDLFRSPYATLGEAVTHTKIVNTSTWNSSQYVVMGDPALVVAEPYYKVAIDTSSLILEQANTTTVSGSVTDRDGTLLANYNDAAFLTVFSTKRHLEYQNTADGVHVSWDRDGRALFRGSTAVENGVFSQTLFVPENAELGEDARVSVYIHSQADARDGAGAVEGIPVVSGTTSIEDVDGPAIQARLDGQLLLQNGLIYPGSVLELDVFDETGLNLSGSSEAGILFDLIEVRQADEPVNAVFQADLTPYFEYDMGNYQRGSLSWPIPEIEKGQYELRIRAIDNLNNRSLVNYRVEIREVTSVAQLSALEIFNYPNPCAGETDILFKVNRDNCLVTVKIYTVAGRLIRELGPEPAQPIPQQNRLHWDGRDTDGDPVANGVYLYKLTVESFFETTADRRSYFNKLMVHR